LIQVLFEKLTFLVQSIYKTQSFNLINICLSNFKTFRETMKNEFLKLMKKLV